MSAKPAGLIDGAARWINSKAAFVLAFMLVLAGLTMALGRTAATFAGANGHSATRGATGGPCGEVLAWFEPDARLKSVDDFLTQFGATIVGGPDEEGAYQLHFGALSLDDALRVSAHAPAFSRTRANARCTAAEPSVPIGNAS
ncbi:hypothetical protein [Paraburkholderia caballeronis]|uniref:Uncharacterized protein n=1 Tax=Paraburkholderia caballeronis TaxID=416943 RepID=A0A1H7P105_9BURK|nr:hypothetical protein [Paraburkholderia caballeronis]PXW25455.1 hypothetical protein C7403_105138 [Paraburkholderia caballeronis]PXX01062.1 hypothetical protein C7407_105137 [Paraburkholderia caballeronis]RAJ99585.1 hypothetical protein C7409_105314 [Paraburkholderia caballeronis]TDV11436.1 hypothetical protein C7408_11284 [Paraburkholderia caballeronis]TDV14626.1 hypothetical protein C7406_11384 [Paraburkholderia caballeronis]